MARAVGTLPDGEVPRHRRSDGALVGRVGANYYDPQTWRRSAAGVPELGWALAREHWGHGYATEAALAVREWLGAPRVVSLITAENLRSQQVAQRLGARPEQTVVLPGHGPHVVWVHPVSVGSTELTQERRRRPVRRRSGKT